MAKETVLAVLKEIREILKIKFPSEIVVRNNDGRFVRNSDGTVTDKQLSLIWYPTAAKKMTWEEAKKECNRLGCRLPTTHELFSLVDVNKYDPAIDKEIFPDTKTNDWYWTITPCPWYTGIARIVNFYCGGVDYDYRGSSNWVRPVRSSQ